MKSNLFPTGITALLLLVLPTLLSAQQETWYARFVAISHFLNNSHNGTLQEEGDWIWTSKGGSILRQSHYGNTLEDYALGLRPNYFFQDEINAHRLFIGRQDKSSDDSLRVVVVSPTGGRIVYPLSELNEPWDITGPAAVKIADHQYLIFAKDFFHKIEVDDNGLVNILWTKDGFFKAISGAVQVGNNVVLCDQEGSLTMVNQEAEILWEQSFDTQFYGIELGLNGTLLSFGAKNGMAYLLSTDGDGAMLWEKSFADEAFFRDLIVDSNEDLVLTGKSIQETISLLKLTSTGEMIWTQTLPESTEGINLIESQYGGYWVLGYAGNIAYLYRTDEDGMTGDLLEEENPLMAVNGIKTGQPNAPGNLLYEYFHPVDSTTISLFASSLWISAMENGNLHLAAQTYGQPDFQPGYIGSDPLALGRIWELQTAQIDLVREDMRDGVKDEPWPIDVLTWPAKGNPHLLFNGAKVEIPFDMAPFKDVNNDGIYNPYDKDYPLIKGDKMWWWVINDDTPHANSGGNPLMVDVKCALYAFGCDDQEVVYNSSFIDLEVINRSDVDYSDVKIGIFNDFDIGCYTDDYIGSLPASNAVYAYNKTAIDGENTGCGGVDPFLGDMPLQSVSFLNQEMTSAMYYNNINVNNPPHAITDPNLPIEFNNYLNSIWRDGTPLTSGGTGYNPQSNDFTDFVFPGNPAEINAWSECQTADAFSDKRMVMATDFGNLSVGASVQLDLAYVTHTDLSLPCPDISSVEDDLSLVKSFYEDGWLNARVDLGPDRPIMIGEEVTLSAPTGALAYLWSTGETTSSITVNTDGDYSVTVTTPLGCEITGKVRLGNPSNTEELVEADGIKLYPNPFTSELYLEVLHDTNHDLRLLNTLGAVVWQGELRGTELKSLSLDFLAEGIYYLQAYSNQQLRGTYKVIKIR